MPFFYSVSIDDFYKYGNDFQRYLVDNTPVVGKGKVGVVFNVQLLYPGLAALQRRNQFAREWHMDYDTTKSEEDSVKFTHLLQSGDSECFTEFNTNECEITLDDEFLSRHTNNKDDLIQTHHFNMYLNENEHKIPLVPKQIEANKIYTFNSHVHRIVLPTKPQFRFIYRVWEGYKDEHFNSIYNGGMRYESIVGKDDKVTSNIIVEKDKIILNYNE